MRSALSLTLSFVTFGVLAVSANAQTTGQLFQFADPLTPNTSISQENSQFSVLASAVGAAIQHTDNQPTGTPPANQPNTIPALVRYNFDMSGHVTSFGSVATSVYYYISENQSVPQMNDVLVADVDSSNLSNYNTENTGFISFYGTNTATSAANDLLLRIRYSTATLSTGGAGSFGSTTSTATSTTVTYLGGSLLEPTLAGTSEGGEFTYQFGTEPGSGTFRSSGFIGSIGNAPNTPPVPEPASIAAVALGGLLTLRKRRRA